MDHRLGSEDPTYVAPLEAPASRRPPITEIGIISWLRHNLFSSLTDTLITIITLAVLGVILGGILNWALFSAQWEVVFLNLRILNLGNQFPVSDAWRVQLVALIIIFLSLLSVGIWGGMTRGAVMVMAIIGVAMVVIPLITIPVPEPTFYTYVDANYESRQVNFTADKDQGITFTLDPLVTAEDYLVENIMGYVENNRQQNNTSFDAFNEASTQINFTQERDPTQYDLSAAVQVWDREGNVIAQSEFSEGSTESLNFTWQAPDTAWYTFTAVKDEENSDAVGAAWLKVDNLIIDRNTLTSRAERIERYGEPPQLDCRACATTTNRTDVRFEGIRTLAQWFSLQLAPFLLETRSFFFLAVIAGSLGYIIAKAARNYRLKNIQGLLDRLERPLGILGGILFIAYIGVQILSGFIPGLSAARIPLLAAFTLAMLLYVLVLLGKGRTSRAGGLLWLIAIPLSLAILTGSENSTVLPPVSTANFGGLLLTLLLSAVAIIVSFPIGMLLALGRQSTLPVVSLLCTLFIEVLRGVPLITLLFMGRLILPFFGFGLGDVDLLIRISVVLTMFTSAYLAEVIRGGLQIIPKGQLEAAHALGISDYWTTISIVLPQALRAVIPAIMGQAVSLFKDSTLVYVVGLFELLGTMNQILGDSQTGYLLFPREGYLYVGALFFIFSYIMAYISRHIERTGAGAVRRETI